jgi:hypothetical protein
LVECKPCLLVLYTARERDESWSRLHGDLLHEDYLGKPIAMPVPGPGVPRELALVMLRPPREWQRYVMGATAGAGCALLPTAVAVGVLVVLVILAVTACRWADDVPSARAVKRRASGETHTGGGVGSP